MIILTGQGDKAFCSVGDQRVRGDSGYKTDEHATGRFHVTDLHVQMRRTPTRQFTACLRQFADGACARGPP